MENDNTNSSKKGTYVIILEAEFDDLLKAEKGWVKEVKGQEYVYSFQLKKKAPNISILVYSSISPDGLSKKCSSDAIRVCAVNTVLNRGVIKTNRINRTSGWNVRLAEKVLDVLSQIK